MATYIDLSAASLSTIYAVAFGLPSLIANDDLTTDGIKDLTVSLKEHYRESFEGGYVVPKEVDDMIIKALHSKFPINFFAKEKTWKL